MKIHQSSFEAVDVLPRLTIDHFAFGEHTHQA
jgi:hypothetical protein